MLLFYFKMLHFLNQKLLFYSTIAINLPIIKNNSKRSKISSSLKKVLSLINSTLSKTNTLQFTIQKTQLFGYRIKQNIAIDDNITFFYF